MHPTKSLLGATKLIASLAALAAGPSASHAASVFLDPDRTEVAVGEQTLTLELFMDFRDDATIGGGIDLGLQGPIALVGFTPSPWFLSEPDPAFTGFGSALADGELEIHWGHFDGLGGLQKLGDLTVSLLDVGLARIEIDINSTFGGFFGTNGLPIDVFLVGAEAIVVPEPRTFLISGLGLLVLAWHARARTTR